MKSITLHIALAHKVSTCVFGAVRVETGSSAMALSVEPLAIVGGHSLALFHDLVQAQPLPQPADIAALVMVFVGQERFSDSVTLSRFVPAAVKTLCFVGILKFTQEVEVI